jgi:hypothetical protein
MSLTAYITVGLLGVVAGPLLVHGIGTALPGKYGAGYNRVLIKLGIKGGDQWLIEQTDQSTVELLHLSEEDEPGVYSIDGRDEKEFKEDQAGLMMRLFDTKIGLSCANTTAIFRQSDALIAEKEHEKTVSPDGGAKVTDDYEIDDIADLREKGTVGRVEKERRTENGDRVHRIMELINPFVGVDGGREVVDARAVVSVLKHNGSTETPRRAAKNAELAEAERSSRSDLVQTAGMLGAAMLGGVLVYLGMSQGGGGGGGGGTTVPVMLNTMDLLQQVALGVL